MPTQRNNVRRPNRQVNQEVGGREEWRPGYDGRREEREAWASRDRDWDRDVWDRDRDDDSRTRAAYGHELDSGRFVQGDRRFVERGAEQLGYDRVERTGYGSQGYGYGSSGYGYGATPGYGSPGHRGKGPRNFMRSDERICERVCEVLTDDDRIDASGIDVEVKDGEVTLSGEVDDRRAKRLAEDVIEHLPGVTDVQNRLRVRRGLFEKSGTEAALDHLNSFLRGELSAVETYRMALDKLDRGSQARGELEGCKRSHEERVKMLRNEILRLGGTPATGSGPWGVFAKTIEAGARVLGDKVAIAALEEGEDHGLKDYKDDIEKLEPEFRNLVRSRLLPAQEDTHSRMSTLKHRLS